MDEEGYFFMTDRLKQHDQCERLQGLAGRGGDALGTRHPAGARGLHHRGARRVPRRDPSRRSFVLRAEAKGKTSAEDIIAWARDHMAAYKRPSSCSSSESLPKSGSGKVMWRLLQIRRPRPRRHCARPLPLHLRNPDPG